MTWKSSRPPWVAVSARRDDMKLQVLVVLGFAVAVFSSPARAELSPTQRNELRAQLYMLADAFDGGDASKAAQAVTVFQQWRSRHGAALPLNWLCQRAGELTRDDFDSDSEEVLQFIAMVRKLGDDCADAAAPSSDTSAARQTLAKVLSAEEYRVQINDSDNWWERAIIRFVQWLDDTLSRLMSTATAAKIANVVFYIMLGLLLLPLILLVAHLVWKQFRSREAALPVATARSLAALEKADVHLARAREFFQHGDFVESLKQYHLAVLAHLEQCGIVAHDRARTNWEYLAQVQRKTDSAASLALLRHLNLVYDKTVFGMQPCNAVLVEEFSQAVDKFLAGMSRLNAPPVSS